MKLTDSQHILLAERLAEFMMSTLDARSLERMVFDMYLDEYLLMKSEDLIFEAESFGVEIPSVLVV